MAFNSQFLKMNIGFKMSLTTHFENNFRKAIKYILEYNSDTRKFVLDDKNSILAEYKWVNEAFSELGITLGVN